MRLLRLVALAGLALFALGAVGATVASAEEDAGSPSILCLVAGCERLEGTLKGGSSALAGLTNVKGLEGTGTEMTLKSCEAVVGTETKDIRLCKDVTIKITGVKVTGTTSNCKTEGDEAGVTLMLLDLHTASELSTTKVLQPLLLAKLLNAKLEALPVIMTCGVLKEELKGTLGCLLLPGLANIATTAEVELTCKVNAAKDPETGTCQQLCEWLKETPFMVNLGGGFEDAWMEIKLKGKLSKDIFIDD